MEDELLEGAGEILQWIYIIATYVWVAICLMVTAQKTNTPNGWLAWIPVADVYLMSQIAGKAWWWLLLCLIPIVNIVIFTILFWKICEARGKPGWWSLLIVFVPIVGWVMLGIVAFDK